MRVILAQPRGYCAGVDRAVDAVERALLNPRAEALLVFARAAGLSSVTTEAILRLRAVDCGMSVENVAQAMAKFTRLPRDSARRVLSFFRIRLEKPASTAAAPSVTAQYQ